MTRSTVNPTRISRLVAFCAHLLIQRRRLLLALCLAMTVAMGLSATRLRLDPGFNKMVPLQHPYMQIFTKYASAFSGANTVLVSLRWKGEGDIYNRTFMDKLRHATDDVFFIQGVERPRVYSLFTPNVRYTEVTEDGFRGDVVLPGRFSGTPEELDQVRSNVARSGQIGRLVSNDLKSALIRAELSEVDPATGKAIDYSRVAHELENIRAKFSGQDVEVNIVGFAKLVGDVEEGITSVLIFFAVAFLITTLMLYFYTRSGKTTLLALIVAMLPVGWLLGLLPLLGYGIDPMSILVPFLIFSIGVSHAVQMTNAWRQEVVRGHDPVESARTAFSKLFVPGTVALLTNALGFMVIMQIKIDIVRELGITACLGVLLMIVTNKIFLPILLSYTQLEPKVIEAGKRQAERGAAGTSMWSGFGRLARRGPAIGVFVVSLALLAVGAVQSRALKVGDIGNGAPELRAMSRYNQDSEAIVRQYNIGVDALTVMVEPTGFDDGCLHYPVMSAVERFEMHMRGVSGVQSVVSVASLGKVVIGAFNEGNPRWEALPRSSDGLSQGAKAFDPDNGMNTSNCQAIQVLIYTANHEGATIAHIVKEIKAFTAADQTPNVAFRLAGGNVGVMAATNEAVEEAEVTMLLAIFGAITLLCLLTFRSWRAVLCIIVPLTLVSILCNALMARLGIGLKVSTLPVITLGVGVGVDYGIYLYERLQHQLRETDQTLPQAFAEAMRQRGTAALFTAVTMCIGVGTWAFAALKFQADMGILLAFMFLVNLFGAALLLPALAAWLGVEQEERARCPRVCIARGRCFAGQHHPGPQGWKAQFGSGMSTRAFTAWQLAGLTLPNRFVKAATFEGRTRGGVPGEALAAFHAGIAQGGTALTTVAYCAVAPGARTFEDQICVDEAVMPGLRRLAGAVHDAGGLVSAQLAHAGAFSRLRRPLGQRSRGPSVTLNDYGLLAGEPIAGAMRPRDFDTVVAQYAASAARLKAAGFDALEIHMGHGYLLSQFISPATNRRTDAYGGNLFNRMRLPLQVLDAVRKAVGDDMPLIAKLNLEDGLPGGVCVNNSIEACRMLAAGGINAIELSGGFVSRSPMFLFRGESPLPEMIRNERSAIFRCFFRLAGPRLFPSLPFTPLYFLEQARRVRQAVDVPLIYLGGVSSGDDVQRVLDEEGFDAVALGRPLLHDPGFVQRLRANGQHASGCTHCNRCVGLLDAPGGVRCTLT